MIPENENDTKLIFNITFIKLIASSVFAVLGADFGPNIKNLSLTLQF